MRPGAAKAFTLIETLVVIAIIGVLVALLLPAVQQAREAVNRAKCQNNLRQFGMAMHNYHDARTHLPPLYATADGAPRQQGSTWAAHVLPYIEQQAMYDLWAAPDAPPQSNTMPGGLRFSSRVAAAGVRTPVPLFFCPSRRQPMNAPPPPAGLVEAMLTDYVVSAGTDETALTPPGPAVAARNNTGPFNVWRGLEALSTLACCNTLDAGAFGAKVTIPGVTDGASNTLMMGEKQVQSAEFFGLPNTDSTVFRPQNMNSISRNAGLAPLPRRPLLLLPSGAVQPNLSQFGSWHPGVCYFVFCDGSVRGVRESIPNGVMRLLGNRADGEVAEYAAFVN